MVNMRKAWTVAAVAFVLAAIALIHGCHEQYLDDHEVVGIGKTVKIKYGFYEGCKGTVLEEVWGDEVKDREGRVHPSIFAGYAVDLTCNNEHTGDRFFSKDFLLVIR